MHHRPAKRDLRVGIGNMQSHHTFGLHTWRVYVVIAATPILIGLSYLTERFLPREFTILSVTFAILSAIASLYLVLRSRRGFLDIHDDGIRSGDGLFPGKTFKWDDLVNVSFESSGLGEKGTMIARFSDGTLEVPPELVGYDAVKDALQVRSERATS